MLNNPILTLEKHYPPVKLFLQRFGIPETQPGPEHLKKILNHFSRIPYENISKLIKLNEAKGEWDRLRLPEELFVDYLEKNLGGTCYSLTYFLWTILDYCGYKTGPVVMDMKWADAAHCGLIVYMDEERFLLDPGYLLSNPIPLVTRNRIYHFDNFTGVEITYDSFSELYQLYTFNKKEKKYRYKFLIEELSIDRFLLRWKGSFYQKSMRHICLTKVDHENKGRVYIRNNFIRYYSEDSKENIKLSLEEAAKKFFNIRPELIENARSAIIGGS